MYDEYPMHVWRNPIILLSSSVFVGKNFSPQLWYKSKVLLDLLTPRNANVGTLARDQHYAWSQCHDTPEHHLSGRNHLGKPQQEKQTGNLLLMIRKDA